MVENIRSRIKVSRGGSPGLVIIGWDSCCKGREFESRHCILDGHLFTFICCKNFNVCKMTKVGRKEAHFKKKITVSKLECWFFRTDWKLASFSSRLNRFKPVLVPVPPRRVQIQHHKCALDQVNITCMADHIFPEPSVKLFHGKSSER